MKHSTLLRIVLPAGFVLGALMGCSTRSNNGIATFSPRSTITAEDLARSPSVPIEQLLASRVPGMIVTHAADGRMVMHLRGVSTLSDDGGEPLFVVNGVPLGNGSNLGAISRSEIDSIDVLRDPASTAEWGIRGTNGVILITLKS